MKGSSLHISGLVAVGIGICTLRNERWKGEASTSGRLDSYRVRLSLSAGEATQSPGKFWRGGERGIQQARSLDVHTTVHS